MEDSDDPEVYIEDEAGSQQYDVSESDDDDGVDDSLYEGENEWVMTMRKRFGLTASGGSDLFVCGWTDPTFLFLLPTLMSVVFVQGDAATQTPPHRRARRNPAASHGSRDRSCLGGRSAVPVRGHKLSGRRPRQKGDSRTPSAARQMVPVERLHLPPHDGWDGRWTKRRMGLKVMHDNYAILDRRFDESSTTAIPSDVAWASCDPDRADLPSTLCLAAYVGLATRKGWADGVALVALSFQLFGAFVFIIPEFMTGCENMIPHGEKNCSPGFSLFEIFYFWFGVGVNGLGDCALRHDFQHLAVVRIEGKVFKLYVAVVIGKGLKIKYKEREGFIAH